MTPFSTRITLDKPGDVYHCGEVISGTVTVVVNEACKGLELILAVGCKGTGHAPTQQINYKIDTERWTLSAGDWMPGTANYPFSIKTPDGYSYDGTIIKVDWFLRTGVVRETQDVIRQTMQGSDLEGEDLLQLLILPGEVTQNDLDQKQASQFVLSESAKSMTGCIIPSLLLILGGSMAAWWGWAKDFSLPGFVIAFVGVAAFGFSVRQVLINRKIAMIELRIGATVVWPGEQVPCSVTVKANAPLEIEQASLTIKGWEHVKKFTGIHRETGPVNMHVIYMEEREINLPCRKIPAGTSIELSGEYRVPAQTFGTMDFSSEVKLLWRLEPKIKIVGSPDWFDLIPVRVLPRMPI